MYSIVISALKLLVLLANWAARESAVSEGVRQERERELKEVFQSLSKAVDVTVEFKDKTDEEVERIIEDKGWYRGD